MGLYGSIIDADESHTTLALAFEDRTNTEALQLDSSPSTVTIEP